MATTTSSRQARRDAEKKRIKYKNNYVSLFAMLFNSSVDVENLPNELPKRYLLRTLRNKGGIAFDKQTKLFLPFHGMEINVYGLPKRYTLIGYNGYIQVRDAKDVVILRANDLLFSIQEYFEQQAEKLVDIDLAIEQNLEAIKTMTVIEVPDEETLLSAKNAYENRRIGAVVMFKNKYSMTGNETKSMSTGAQYLVKDLLENRKEILNETLSRIGINVANVDKKERVQGEEIKASQGYAIDCINTLIRTFNHDAKVGGLDIRLKGKTSLIEETELERKQIKNEIKENKEENKNEL